MKIKDFKGKKITVMGLGLHGGGLGAAQFSVQAGAKVLVTDLRKKEDLAESLQKLKGLPIKYVLGQHRSEDFINTDLIIKNPAVPNNSQYLEIASKHQVPIETDVGIFFELCPALIIGVTGTRGKSTTASLIAEFLSQKYKVALAGNIRQSVLLELPKINKETLVVLELSSWQLEGLVQHKKSPAVAIITNIMPDHLNRYKTMHDYIEAKKTIFKFQHKKDWLILNEEDSIVRQFAQESKSQVVFFNKKQVNLPARLCQTLQAGQSPLQLLGEHNISNLAAALKVAELFRIPEKKIQKALKNFRGLEGRLELIAEIKGVKYINDTCATIPEAAIAAINALSSQPVFNSVILIAGGADKNLDFNQLSQTIKQKVKTLILLEGTATDKLEKSVKSQTNIEIKKINNMEEAVKLAAQEAKAKDIVLLSPGCASFGLFRHEFERGETFKKAVSKLK